MLLCLLFVLYQKEIKEELAKKKKKKKKKKKENVHEFCFFIVILALWLFSLMVAHIAFCFISVCNFIYCRILLSISSEDKGEVGIEKQ